MAVAGHFLLAKPDFFKNRGGQCVRLHHCCSCNRLDGHALCVRSIHVPGGNLARSHRECVQHKQACPGEGARDPDAPPRDDHTETGSRTKPSILQDTCA